MLRAEIRDLDAFSGAVRWVCTNKNLTCPSNLQLLTQDDPAEQIKAYRKTAYISGSIGAVVYLTAAWLIFLGSYRDMLGQLAKRNASAAEDEATTASKARPVGGGKKNKTAKAAEGKKSKKAKKDDDDEEAAKEEEDKDEEGGDDDSDSEEDSSSSD